jgi:PKD domain
MAAHFDVLARVQTMKLLFVCLALISLGAACNTAKPPVEPATREPAIQNPPIQNPSGPVTAKLIASRTSGVAPLAVLFDGSGSTTSTAGINTFHQITYSFLFGDDRGQHWATSGESKNTELGGPIAAHVFDVPGTYTVRMQATEPSGAKAESSVTITVQDPNTVYGNTKTVCVSTSSNFSGCPNGASQATSIPADLNAKRVLLRRGESFGDLTITDGQVGVLVAPFGAGTAKPNVNRVEVGAWRPQTATFASDITIMDLKVSNGMQQSVGHRVLFYRNELTNPSSTANNSIFFGEPQYWALDDPFRAVPSSAFYNAHEIFIVENTVIGTTDGQTLVNAYGDGSRIAMLGNVMGTAAQHTVRITKLNQSVIVHNELRGGSADGIRHALKLHSGGLTPYADNCVTSGITWATSRVVIAKNIFGHQNDNNQWTVALAPQNDAVAEGIEDVVIEKNRFIRGSRTETDLVITGRRIGTRGNTVGSTAASASVGSDGHGGGLPSDWKGPYFSQ